jgi:hypothetical protein
MATLDELKEQPFEEWKAEILTDYERTKTSWRVVGDWLYPGKENNIYFGSDVVYHVCPANHQRLISNLSGVDSGVANMEKGCNMCGAEVPEGTKMIMLLGKL